MKSVNVVEQFRSCTHKLDNKNFNLLDADPEVERQLLQILSDNALTLPINSKQLAQRMNLLRFKPVNQDILHYFLQKLVAQSHISINNINSSSESGYEVTLVDHSRVI